VFELLQNTFRMSSRKKVRWRECQFTRSTRRFVPPTSGLGKKSSWQGKGSRGWTPRPPATTKVSHSPEISEQ